MAIRNRVSRKLQAIPLGGLIAVLAFVLSLRADSPPTMVPVRFKEGLTHGFLVVSTLHGEILGDGDLIQLVKADQVDNHLRYHFKDGSVHEETSVFSQRREFRLLNYHLLQKGPSFKHPVEVWIDVAAGQVKVSATDKDGNAKVTTDQLKLPPDLANGLVLTLLKNVRSDGALRLSMVAATPKPRLVHLAISTMGEEAFSFARSSRKALHYVVKVEIGGVAGLVAPLLGKEVPDTHVWILGGEAPTFVKSEGPLCMDCPVWRVELASPVWPASPRHASSGESGR